MAQCSRCNEETELYERGIPICPSCDGARASSAPRKQTVGDAQALAFSASGSESEANS
jgi:hypothetical protein